MTASLTWACKYLSMHGMCDMHPLLFLPETVTLRVGQTMLS